jgi:hypothetical protein
MWVRSEARGDVVQRAVVEEQQILNLVNPREKQSTLCHQPLTTHHNHLHHPPNTTITTTTNHSPQPPAPPTKYNNHNHNQPLTTTTCTTHQVQYSHAQPTTHHYKRHYPPNKAQVQEQESKISSHRALTPVWCDPVAQEVPHARVPRVQQAV